MSSYNFLFEIIRAGLGAEKGVPVLSEKITDDVAGKLFSLAEKHDMSPFLAYCADKAGLGGSCARMGELCMNNQLKAVYRHERMAYETDRMSRILSDEKIKHVLLKGSVIRHLYPEAWLRTSCDVDILVDPGDLDRAVQAFIEKLGYEVINKSDHDIGMMSKNGTHLELHYRLSNITEVQTGDSLLSDVWDQTERISDGEYCLRMKRDMLLYYHMFHLVKHIKNGGCGIKPFLDLVILNEKGYLTESGEKMLEKGGLIGSYRLCSRLSEVWFGGREHDEQTKRLEGFVLDGGTYGTMFNRVSIRQKLKGGKLRYALGRIFIPYKTMIYRYPYLENRRWLMPYCTVKRWIDLLLEGKGRLSFMELSTNDRLSDEVKENVNKLWEDLEL